MYDVRAVNFQFTETKLKYVTLSLLLSQGGSQEAVVNVGQPSLGPINPL